MSWSVLALASPSAGGLSPDSRLVTPGSQICLFDRGLDVWLLSIHDFVELFGRRQLELGTLDANNLGNPRDPDVLDRI